MSKPFDAATKFLVEAAPEEWVRFLGLPPGETRIVDTDISTVSAAADRALFVEAGVPYGIQIEFQGNGDPIFETRLLQYRTALRLRWGVPFTSVAVLLRPFTDHKRLQGRHLEPGPDGKIEVSFRYRVVRVWLIPVEQLLEGPLALLPLAPVSKVRRRDLPALLKRIEERMVREASPSVADDLRTATYVLMGLRYPKEYVKMILSQNVLEQSSTYQDIKLKNYRKMLMHLAEPRLQAPTSEQKQTLEAIESPEVLEGLVARLFQTTTWKDLLASVPPTSAPQN